MTSMLDLSGTKPIPFQRLLQVELRKMGDTKAGRWLLIAGAGFGVLVVLGFFIWGEAEERQFFDLMGYAGTPFMFLLPVLGILTVTQEWGQRTALATFTHSPRRGRVLWAKTVAALLYGLAAIAIAGVLALVLAPLGGADEPFADFSVWYLLRIVLSLELGVLWGLAFGLLFLNSAFAIVLYFLIPIVVSIVTELWTAASDNLLWFDLNTSMSALFQPESLTGERWAQIGVGALIWIVIPGTIGFLRALRSEVK